MQLTPEEIAEQQKNEENTKKKYITPIIQERWGKENSDNIIMEYYFTDGRVNIDGDKVSRGEKKKADYLLLFNLYLKEMYWFSLKCKYKIME